MSVLSARVSVFVCLCVSVYQEPLLTAAYTADRYQVCYLLTATHQNHHDDYNSAAAAAAAAAAGALNVSKCCLMFTGHSVTE